MAVLWGGVVVLATNLVLPGMLHPSAAKPLRAALWVVPFGLALGFEAYLLLGSGRVVAHNLLRLGAAVAYTLGISGMAFLGGAPTAFAWVFVMSQALGATVGYAAIVRTLRPRAFDKLSDARSLLGYGLKSHIAAIAGHATLRLDQLLLSILAPSAELGLYAVAVSMAGAVGPLFTASATVVIPRVSRISDPAEAVRETWRTLGVGLAISLPVVLAAFMLFPTILHVLFGSAFQGALGAARVLLAASVFQGANAILGNSLRSLGRPGAPAMAETVGAAVTAGLLLLLLPSMRAMGAAVASLGAYATVTGIYCAALMAHKGSHQRRGRAKS